MRLDVQHYFGATASGGFMTSAINQAVLFIKQFIDTNLGTQTTYDPQDLATYFMAIADCMNLIAEIKRDIRLLNMQVVQWPYFIPHAMFDLLEICSPEAKPDLSTSTVPASGSAARYYAAHLRSTTDRLNQLINLLNGLAIPSEMALFGYNDDLYAHIYADTSDVLTAQQYVFASTGSWVYSDDQVHEGSSIIFKEWPYNPEGKRWKTIDEMLDRLEEMILAISAYRSNSSALIQNLRNAYGTQRLRVVLPLDTQNLIPLDIVYDPDMLISIENASLQDQVWPSGFVSSADLSSVRGTPFIVDDDESVVIQKYGMINLPLQFHTPAPSITQEMIGRALRFHPCFQTRENAMVYTASVPQGEKRNVITPDGCYGFAIITRLVVGFVDDNGELETVSILNRRDAANYAVNVMMLNDFAHAPSLIYCTHQKTDTTETLTLEAYSACRDVELTLRPDEMQQWWIGLTEIAWGTNLSREVRGARAIL
nr:capsid protein [Marmot picobirnavirus]